MVPGAFISIRRIMSHYCVQPFTPTDQSINAGWEGRSFFHSGHRDFLRIRARRIQKRFPQDYH